MACSAASEASKESYDTNPYDKERPVASSLPTWAASTNRPNAEKVSCKILSSTSGDKLPMNKLAPTSIRFNVALSVPTLLLAQLTRSGRPYTLTMFMINCAYSASLGARNSTKAMFLWLPNTLSLGMYTLTTRPTCVNNSHNRASLTLESKLPT